MSKVLARLNPKLTNYMSTGCGGHGGLTSQDVAAALSYCKDPVASLLLRVKYSGHDADRPKLARAFKELLEAAALRRGWRTKKELVYERMAVGVLVEYLDCRCGTCKGRRVVAKWQTDKAGRRIKLADEVCPECEGTGVFSANNSERARILEMTPQSFNNTWLDRWEFALSELCRLDAIGNSAVKNGLS